MTLDALSALTGVNRGQLSRFCRGKFKTESKNLQRVVAMLQIHLASKIQAKDALVEVALPDLIDHVTSIWRNAGSKRGAYVEAIKAIERLVP